LFSLFTMQRIAKPLQWWPYQLVTLEMYISITAILTYFFRDVRFNACWWPMDDALLLFSYTTN